MDKKDILKHKLAEIEGKKQTNFSMEAEKEPTNEELVLKPSINLPEDDVKYKRKDIESGYITDKNEIGFYKSIQAYDIIDNKLLGDFNAVGSYVLSKEIIEELENLPKVYTSAYGKSIFCESVKEFPNYGHIQFSVKMISGVPKVGFTTAILELLEPIERINGYIENTNTATISTDVVKEDPTNSLVFEQYKIAQTIDGTAAEIENESGFTNILARHEYISQLQQVWKNRGFILEKELYEARIRELTKHRSARGILEEFNKQVFAIQGIFLNSKDINFYKHLNQLLNGILENQKDEILSDSDLMAKISEMQSKYSNNLLSMLNSTRLLYLSQTQMPYAFQIVAGQQTVESSRSDKPYNLNNPSVNVANESAKKPEIKGKEANDNDALFKSFFNDLKPIKDNNHNFNDYDFSTNTFKNQEQKFVSNFGNTVQKQNKTEEIAKQQGNNQESESDDINNNIKEFMRHHEENLLDNNAINAETPAGKSVIEEEFTQH